MQFDSVEQEKKLFLLFWLEGELFGADVCKIREVIKHQQPKFIPLMQSYYRGVINLRGEVISVIDLGKKLELPDSGSQRQLQIIICRDEQLIAAEIDELIGVQGIDDDKIESNPAMQRRIPENFFEGVALVEEGLATIIDISATFSEYDLETFDSVKRKVS